MRALNERQNRVKRCYFNGLKPHKKEHNSSCLWGYAGIYFDTIAENNDTGKALFFKGSSDFCDLDIKQTKF